MRDGRAVGGQENLEIAYPRGDNMNKSKKEGGEIVPRTLLSKVSGVFITQDWTAIQ